jgi:hypothetical protein
MEEITGVPAKSVLGQPLARVVFSSKRHFVTGVLDRALGGEELPSFELPVRSKTGQRITLLCSASALYEHTQVTLPKAAPPQHCPSQR